MTSALRPNQAARPDEVVNQVVSALLPRLGPAVDRSLIEDTARRAVIELTDGARFVDFVPVLAEHRVREEFRRIPAGLVPGLA